MRNRTILPVVLIALLLGAVFGIGISRAVIPAVIIDGSGTSQFPAIDSDTYYLSGTSLNSRLQGNWGSTDITTTGDVAAGDLNFTSEFFYGANNRTDVLANPEQAASYIVWVEGGVYYAKNGHASVVTSNENAATLINSLSGTVLIKGNIHLTNGIVLKSGMNLIGVAYNSTNLITDAAIPNVISLAYGSRTDLPDLEIKNINIIKGTTSFVNGIHLTYACNVNIENIYIYDGTGSGITLENCEIINIINPRIGKGSYGIEFVGWNGEISINEGMLYQQTANGIIVRSSNIVKITKTDIWGVGTHGILLEDAVNTIDNCIIENNNIHDNTFYGIAVSTATFTNSAINYNQVGNGNVWGGINAVATGIKFYGNFGFVTENSGTSSILSGTTAINVTHSLSYTPTAQDITITFTENPSNPPGLWWIQQITSTTFEVNVANDPGVSNLDFSWSVRRTP